ncbi:MAG: hypothetical protein WCG26_14870, partial [Chloroflexales bacterium]
MIIELAKQTYALLVTGAPCAATVSDMCAAVAAGREKPNRRQRRWLAAVALFEAARTERQRVEALHAAHDQATAELGRTLDTLALALTAHEMTAEQMNALPEADQPAWYAAPFVANQQAHRALMRAKLDLRGNDATQPFASLTDALDKEHKAARLCTQRLGALTRDSATKMAVRSCEQFRWQRATDLSIAAVIGEAKAEVAAGKT